MKKAVFGIAKSESHADSTIQKLIDAGFDTDVISTFFHDTKNRYQSYNNPNSENFSDTKLRSHSYNDTHSEKLSDTKLRSQSYTNPNSENFSDTKDVSQSYHNPNSENIHENSHLNYTKNKKTGSMGIEKHTKAPEGATTGAAAGGLIGGAIGLLAGIGALAIPGIGPFIAAGPIMATLGGAALGGGAGGLVGALTGLAIPEFEAKRYEDRLKSGGILISVHCDSSEDIDRAKRILEANKIENISTAKEKAGVRS